MPVRLPPLNSLKAFESAARNLSVKRAAIELNVTSAAVSHQTKNTRPKASPTPVMRWAIDIIMVSIGR